MGITQAEIDEFNELKNQKKRVDVLGFLAGKIPISNNHEKFNEIQKILAGSKLGTGEVFGSSPLLPSPIMMATPCSTMPNPNQEMFQFWPGPAFPNNSFPWGSGPQPHLWPQAMSQYYSHNGPSFARGYQPSCYFGTAPLAYDFHPGPQNAFERATAITPGTIARLTEEKSPRRAEVQRIIAVEDEDHHIYDEDNDSDGDGDTIRETSQVFLYLRSKWGDGISAEVDRCSPVNWIASKLLHGSGSSVSIQSVRPVAYKVPDGPELKSQGRVKVWCRWSRQGNTFSGEFVVYGGDMGAPDLILGQSWAPRHVASVVEPRKPLPSKLHSAKRAERQPDRAVQGESRRKAGSQLAPGRRIVKLAERRRVEKDRSAYVTKVYPTATR